MSIVRGNRVVDVNEDTWFLMSPSVSQAVKRMENVTHISGVDTRNANKRPRFARSAISDIDLPTSELVEYKSDTVDAIDGSSYVELGATERLSNVQSNGFHPDQIPVAK